MNTQTEFEVVEEQVVETAEQVEAIELSLSDLDIVAGGARSRVRLSSIG